MSTDYEEMKCGHKCLHPKVTCDKLSNRHLEYIKQLHHPYRWLKEKWGIGEKKDLGKETNNYEEDNYRVSL